MVTLRPFDSNPKIETLDFSFLIGYGSHVIIQAPQTQTILGVLAALPKGQKALSQYPSTNNLHQSIDSIPKLKNQKGKYVIFRIGLQNIMDSHEKSMEYLLSEVLTS